MERMKGFEDRVSRWISTNEEQLLEEEATLVIRARVKDNIEAAAALVKSKLQAIGARANVNIESGMRPDDLSGNEIVGLVKRAERVLKRGEPLVLRPGDRRKQISGVLIDNYLQQIAQIMDKKYEVRGSYSGHPLILDRYLQVEQTTGETLDPNVRKMLQYQLDLSTKAHPAKFIDAAFDEKDHYFKKLPLKSSFGVIDLSEIAEEDLLLLVAIEKVNSGLSVPMISIHGVGPAVVTRIDSKAIHCRDTGALADRELPEKTYTIRENGMNGGTDVEKRVLRDKNSQHYDYCRLGSKPFDSTPHGVTSYTFQVYKVASKQESMAW